MKTRLGIGAEQKERALKEGISLMQICVEADDLSLVTLRSFFNDDPKVRTSTARRVVDAIDRLVTRKSGRAAS